MGRPALDLDGQRFGRLIATNQLRSSGYGTSRERLCYCDCGQETWVSTTDLTSGHNKSCGCWLRDFKKLAPGVSARNIVLDDYKRGASKRHLSWELTDQQFDDLTSRLCFFCDSPPKTIRKTRRCNGVFVYNGIDRLNNLLGYTIANCVPCCKICNRAKSNLSFEDFMQWIRAIRGKVYAEC
jgi:hypothetical protein